MAKKQPTKEFFSRLRQDLDRANNFIDYFLVCGVKPSLCLNTALYDDDVTAQRNLVLTPEILSKCPPLDKTTINVDDGIIAFCCPKNFQIIEGLSQPEDKIYSFVLANSCATIEYPQKYMTCLTFYEPISAYKKLYDKMMQAKSNTNSKIGNKRILKMQRTLDMKIQETAFQDSKLRSIHGKQIYSSKPRLNYIFIPKTICLVSLYPFIDQHKIILRQILDYSRQPFIQIPIEKVIMNLVIEVPIPPKGIIEVNYYLPKGIDEYLEIEQDRKERKEKEKEKDKSKEKEEMKEIKEKEEKYTMKLSCSSVNKLPPINFNLEELLTFNTDQIITIFTHVLLESRIIFFSKDLNKIFNISLSFIHLLYPFKYNHQIAFLPTEANYSTIESPHSYILGINKTYTNTFFEDNHITTKDMSILIVDIDKKRLLYKSQEPFYTLPRNCLTKLQKEIIELVQLKSRMNLSDKSKRDEFNLMISQSFFTVIINIFKNYSKYLNYDFFSSHENIQSTNTGVLFKIDEFVNSFPSSEQPFYLKLVEDTQMVGEFIYKRMIPQNNQEKLEILFLDEHIQEQYQRWFDAKKEPVLITSSEYEHKNKYIVSKCRELNNDELTYFTIRDNRIKSLNYGQDITLCQDDQIDFQYILFPMMNHEIFFNETNVSDYLISPSLNEDIESINTDLIAKANLNSFEVQTFEMQNYIYLTWLQLWAFSFASMNIEERRYRFDQMISILNKVTHHEIEIFNLLFEALGNQNEEDMILRLYQKLIRFKVNPGAYIYSIIFKMIDKQTIQSLVSNPDAKFFYNDKNVTEAQFKPRTTKNGFEEEVLRNDVMFYRIAYCAECPQMLDLMQLSCDFKAMKRDVLWALCPGCQKYILPKLRVRLGKELNIAPKIEGQTSTVDEVVLHSPYHLKLNIKDGLYKAYGLNLDLNQFKMKFTPLFWDSIWYFMLLKLNYSFFLPYEEKVNLKDKRPTTEFIIKREEILLKPRDSKLSKSTTTKEKKKVSINIKRAKSCKKIFSYAKNKLEIHHVISFGLSSKVIHVLGQSIMDSCVNESTFQNTNLLDNSIISEGSMNRSMDSFYFSPVDYKEGNDNLKRPKFTKLFTMTQEWTVMKLNEHYPLEIVTEVEGDSNLNNSFDNIKPSCPVLFQQEQNEYHNKKSQMTLGEANKEEENQLLKSTITTNELFSNVTIIPNTK